MGLFLGTGQEMVKEEIVNEAHLLVLRTGQGKKIKTSTGQEMSQTKLRSRLSE